MAPAHRATPTQPTGGVVRPDGEIFQSLVASSPARSPYSRVLHVSVLVHVLIGAALVLVPVFWPEAMPDVDYVRILVYNPPPPPPPPLPKGNPMRQETEKRPEPASETPRPKPDDFVAPVEIPRDRLTQVAQNTIPAENQFGSEAGDETGVPEGMEGGVVGGTVGGTVGGVIGGVLGGTGDIPVTNVDQQPRLLRQVKPVYPQDAFIKKVEGTVVLEIYIDSTGRVVRARILQSIPSLDQAAIACVMQWVFAPAIKGGRPVLTLAQAPVTFRIY